MWGQDGWILAEFFFCIFKDWDKIEVHEDAQEVWGWYPAILTNQVCLEVFFTAQDQSGQS